MASESYDVVVLGSGATGLVAAIAAAECGARVGLFEKAGHLGGTTAISGGIVWIPNNPLMAAAGLEDSRARAITYLASLSNGMIDDEMLATLIDTGPELVNWLHRSTPLRLRIVRGFPDYHPEHPGAMRQGGRALECELFPFVDLGDFAALIPDNLHHKMLCEFPIGGSVSSPDFLPEAERVRCNAHGMGPGLVGALLKGCLDRDIVPRLRWRGVDLVMEHGRAAGVRFESPEGLRSVRAERGIIIATGGFEWDPDLVRAFLRGPMTSPVSVPSNTGDGLKMMMRVGVQLGNMREAWWHPTTVIPGEERFGRQYARLVLRERTLPGSIMVNRRGRRFTNEAANYNALGSALHAFDIARFEYANLPCWLIFDQRYIDKYGFTTAQAGLAETRGKLPDWIAGAATLEQLAGKLGIDAAGLVQTVARWNDQVASGRDLDFGRGDSAYDTWAGDQSQLPSTAATLGCLTEPPFYAVEIQSGALGTKGGPRTTRDSQVLDVDGRAIPGLYAAGNAMAGVTGMVYGGGGGTLGPALVFGYRAGRHAAS